MISARLQAIARTFPSNTSPALRRNMSLHLYSGWSPNGAKATITLEELKEAYGLEYKQSNINISTNKQKEPWFIDINPNGRIPALVDGKRGDFKVFESGAILLYLAQHYDPEHKFSFDPAKSPDDYSELLQWIFFAHGGIGPMQGQANHFGRFAKEKIPYAINRYLEETKRLYGVLEIRLKDRDYLAGPGRGTYTIADINAFGWVNIHGFAGIESLDPWPQVKAWVERINERPAVKTGLEAIKAPAIE